MLDKSQRSKTCLTTQKLMPASERLLPTGKIPKPRKCSAVSVLMNGNMVCGVYKDYLILRLGEKAAADALKKSDTRPFDITGKPMKGWVMVEDRGFETDDKLKAWLDRARDFVQTLPPK